MTGVFFDRRHFNFLEHFDWCFIWCGNILFWSILTDVFFDMGIFYLVAL